MTLAAIALSPVVPLWLSLPLIGAGLPLTWQGGRRGLAVLPRMACLGLILLALLNPQLARDETTALPDIVLLLVDDSASMTLGDRTAQSTEALAGLHAKLALLPNLETRVVRLQNASGPGTRLFAGLDQGLADIAKSRLAGIILLTDGQVHDVPETPAQFGAPLHVLLAGHRSDRDRRLVLETTPGFAMVGTQAELAFRVEDVGHEGRVAVTLRRDGGESATVSVPLNRSTKLSIPIDHAGPNVVELEAAAADGELTLQNNSKAISVSGVRDRLRVLLLSGEPHPGERMWRNLLKADPMVDLVHFTILRSPDKDDHTPIQQLSLIAFPTRELFEERLKDFDLIIFDRFRRRNILPPLYYRNIADHVRQGGALLLVAGPELAAADSPAGSALADILPAKADGTVKSEPFLPLVTERGLRHPLFQGLPGAESRPPQWGRWVRAAGSVAAAGSETLMSSADGTPLLLLSHAGDGRVAQLNSDSAWLWGRGWDGGGPQAELLRRLAHWLMKEPALEENQLSGQLVDGRLQVQRRSLDGGDRQVAVTGPDGKTATLDLADRGDGLASGALPSPAPGLWRLKDDQLTALVAVPGQDPLELDEVRATPLKLQAEVAKNGGGLFFLEDGLPGVARVAPGDRSAGAGWLGLVANGQHTVQSSSRRPLLPGWLLLLSISASLALAWWRDAR